MPSTVEQLSPSRVKLTIEIPFSELEPHLKKAYSDIAAQVNVPGFRKGKVPPAVIDQRFGRGAVLQEAINAALPEAYGRAVQSSEIVPLGQPDIEVTKLEDGDVVEFTAELDVRPDFDLPDLSTLSAEVATLPATDEQVDERIELMRQRFATRADVDRAAETGDVVTLDIKASQDGEEIEDAVSEGVAYKLGAGGMIDGLDEAATGLKAGESKTFTAKLVGGPKKDEDAEIEITVTKVQSETLPEVDDEFAQMVSEFDTVEEMRADLAEAVARMARVEQVNEARDKVLESLIAQLDFEVPEGLITEQVEGRTQQITTQLAQAGLTLERYLDEVDEEEATTPEEFWASLEKRTRDSVKAQIVLDKLADDEQLTVEQEELTQMLFQRAAQNNSSPEAEMQHMLEHDHTSEWMGEIRRNKAMALIVNAASVTDADGATVPVAAVRNDGTIDDAVVEEAEAEEKPAKKKAPAKKKPAQDDAADDAAAEQAEETPAKKKAPAKKKPAQDDADGDA